MAGKRRVDLIGSANNKLLRCEKFLETISTEDTLESCLKMMKEVCEVQSKALQGHMKDFAAYQIGDSKYMQNVKQDMSLFIQCIKRKVAKLKPEFLALKLYYHQQRQILKHLKPVTKKSCRDTEIPGKTSYKQASIYNGLDWVLLCLGFVVSYIL